MNDQQKQNNLITQIVVAVLALITCIVLYVNKPVPVALAAPAVVPAVKVEAPTNLVQKTPGLPSGSDNGQAGAPAASGGAGGGAPRSGRGFSSAGG